MQETFAVAHSTVVAHPPDTESEDSSTSSTSSLALRLPFASSAIGATQLYFDSSLSGAEYNFKPFAPGFTATLPKIWSSE